jgi:hypothetical protein
MPLIFKKGTRQLLKVGTSLAGSTACCCVVAPTTGRCCHYEPNTPPTASGPPQDVSSWTISDASVATCTDGVTSTSCNGVFAEGASCTGFNCNTSDTTTLAAGNCWLWKNTDVQLQLSVGAQFVRDDGGACISCVSYLPCTYGIFHCSVTSVLYAYNETTYYEIKSTQPAADINTSSDTPTATCGSGTVVGRDILLHKSKWIKVGQIPCTGTIRDTILAQLQTYDRHYSYLYTYADGVICDGGSVGYTNVIDTLTYAHPIVTGNNGCTC